MDNVSKKLLKVITAQFDLEFEACKDDSTAGKPEAGSFIVTATSQPTFGIEKATTCRVSLQKLVARKVSDQKALLVERAMTAIAETVSFGRSLRQEHPKSIN